MVAWSTKKYRKPKRCGIWHTGIIERFMLPPWWK